MQKSCIIFIFILWFSYPLKAQNEEIEKDSFQYLITRDSVLDDRIYKNYKRYLEKEHLSQKRINILLPSYIKLDIGSLDNFKLLHQIRPSLLSKPNQELCEQYLYQNIALTTLLDHAGLISKFKLTAYQDVLNSTNLLTLDSLKEVVLNSNLEFDDSIKKSYLRHATLASIDSSDNYAMQFANHIVEIYDQLKLDPYKISRFLDAYEKILKVLHNNQFVRQTVDILEDERSYLTTYDRWEHRKINEHFFTMISHHFSNELYNYELNGNKFYIFSLGEHVINFDKIIAEIKDNSIDWEY